MTKMLVLACMVLGPTIGTASTLSVVDPDRPVPSVVAGPGPDDRAAADDLCIYLSKISGREIAVTAAPAPVGMVIHVGADEFVEAQAPEIADLRGDGFVIRCVEAEGRHHLVLAGPQTASSQWAIERFLIDHCGVRWLMPHPKHGEIVPSKQRITIPASLSERHEPDYIGRANCGMYMFARNRKYLRLGPRGGSFGSHEIQRMFSTDEFAAHPEWFAFFKGKRQWWTYGNGWQICTTNPGTVEHAVDYVDRYFKKHPDAVVASVGQNDGSGWCECDTCKAFINSFDPPYTTTERWFHWVNEVAREVAKKHSGRWVEAMAYASTSQPPRFRLEDNVAITKTFVLDSEFDLAEQWMKVCRSVNLYSYMYGNSFMGFRHYPDAAQEFLQWGHGKLGAIAHVTECGGDWAFDGPKYHYLQALHWDVDADMDAVMRDYCADSYGGAAAPMGAFWDRLEQVYERRAPTPYGEKRKRWLFYQWVTWAMNSYVQPNDEFVPYSMDDVAFLDDRIDEAERLASGDGASVQFRVSLVADAWRYYRTMVKSFLEYYRLPVEAQPSSGAEAEASLGLARQIAALRADRRVHDGKMMRHRQLNRRRAGRAYWSWGEALTIFSHERALIEAHCSAYSAHRSGADGTEAALAFWRALPETDVLHPHARTQVALLIQPDPPDLLANGDFERGSTEGWEIVSGTANLTTQGARSGTALSCPSSQVTIRQRVPVTPGARYRLTAWGRYVGASLDWAVPMEAILEFYGGSRRIWSEPTRITWRTTQPDTGWQRLAATYEAPPGCDSVVINLKRRSSGKHLWDDVSFKCTDSGPAVVHGSLIDTFDGAGFDGSAWIETTDHSNDPQPPKVRDGWIRFEGAQQHPLTSTARFDDLFRYEGADRYRLRFRVAMPDGVSDAQTTWSLGIKSGTGTISISESGMFWYVLFPSAKRAVPMVSAYCFQGGARTAGPAFDIDDLPRPATDLWITMHFDPKTVTIHASADGYDESESSFVGSYDHGITDLTADGPVYLKLGDGNCRLDEISLLRPDGGGATDKMGDGTSTPDETRRLFMEGVTE